jgi:hypothetical protein
MGYAASSWMENGYFLYCSIRKLGYLKSKKLESPRAQAQIFIYFYFLFSWFLKRRVENYNSNA